MRTSSSRFLCFTFPSMPRRYRYIRIINSVMTDSAFPGHKPGVAVYTYYYIVIVILTRLVFLFFFAAVSR